ncbi:MAG: ABC transporter ATP-binding protein, partial [Candidatus Methanomethylicia archaeon]
EILCVVGSNGAGKTTILRTISGLIHPKSGNIKFLGKEIHNIPPHKIVEMGIAHVPEGRQVFPQMTVLENLKMGAFTRRAWSKMEDTLEFIYQLFPILKERGKQLAGTLSGGEQQMLAIARGLMAKPSLLMIDELSLGLAPKIVELLFEAIKNINDQGVTILLVEQNIRAALEVSDRGYVLENGRIVLSGKSEELIEDETIKKAYLGL